jgi:hypothetical protein
LLHLISSYYFIIFQVLVKNSQIIIILIIKKIIKTVDHLWPKPTLNTTQLSPWSTSPQNANSSSVPKVLSFLSWYLRSYASRQQITVIPPHGSQGTSGSTLLEHRKIDINIWVNWVLIQITYFKISISETRVTEYDILWAENAINLIKYL